MCIGVPMRVIESDGFTALCERRGERRRVNVMLIERRRRVRVCWSISAMPCACLTRRKRR